MQLQPQLSFRNVPESEALVNAILQRVEQLDKFFPRNVACRVMLEAPHRHHRKGILYHVRIDLTVPGKELVVARDPAKHGAHKDAYVAIRDAFDAADRQLQAYAREMRGYVKSHEPQGFAKIARLFVEDGYGFLTADGGREIYFHEHSIINRPFTSLQVGQEVRVVEVLGDNGPQASTVEVLSGPKPMAQPE